MFNRTLVIHKATNNSLKGKDVSINITELQTPDTYTPVEVYQNEGKGIAEALWNTLPSATVIALMAELDRLQNA